MPSLHEYLNIKIEAHGLPEEQKGVLHFLVTYLDENGYLREPIEVVAQEHIPPLTAERVQHALHVLQQLGPRGIGSRDLRECLLLQIPEDVPYWHVLHAIISFHLEDIRQGNISAIQQQRGFDMREIQLAIQHLKNLNPRPGRLRPHFSTRQELPGRR